MPTFFFLKGTAGGAAIDRNWESLSVSSLESAVKIAQDKLKNAGDGDFIHIVSSDISVTTVTVDYKRRFSQLNK